MRAYNSCSGNPHIMGDTRGRIIEEALRLFSEKGYGEVSVSMIADAVGIKPPSLYKHFPSKRAIFDSILNMMSRRYDEMVSGFGIGGSDPVEDSPSFEAMDGDAIAVMGRALFLFFLEDPCNSMFRRMLSIGRYSDPELDAIYHSQYIDLPLDYQTEVFRRMLDSRGMAGDPRSMALEFYSPMLILMQSCDTDPERKEAALKEIDGHIRHFGRIHFGDESGGADPGDS